MLITRSTGPAQRRSPAPADQGMLSQHLAELRQDLQEAEFRAEWSEDTTLDIDAAVADTRRHCNHG
jgi:hypothetical protein